MYEKCVRYSKRNRPKMRHGMIKFFAHRLLMGQAIPFFFDKRINIAIEAHRHKILREMSKKRRNENGEKEWKKENKENNNNTDN
jgi:hypothetical protein